MYTLYYMPGACSLAVHAILIELGLEYKLENVAVPAGQSRPDSYLKMNPRGSVPTLVWGNNVMREGAGILTYLLDEHENTLLPKKGVERAKVLEWLAFANATLHPAYGRIFMMHRILGDKATENEIYTPTIETIQKIWDEIEAHLKNQPYLCGNDCSIADILVTVIANWTPGLRQKVNFGDRTKALFNNVIARPSYSQAMQVENVTYKVAA